MKLLSLRLRGAIGIYDGLGIDEVNIDFSKFEEGTICVYGDNGAGKTTLIENLTPFRKLFSRPGGLANQFRLKDSCRDLWIELGPDQFRFLININADSGKIESYVYRNGEVMNADGKEGSYNDIVFGLFGTPDLFSSSLFMPQKRVPFSKLSPERREELFNLEGIQAKSKYAADQAKALQAQISELTGRIGQLESTIAELADVDQSIEIGKKLVSDREASIAKIEARLTELNRTLAKLEEQARGQVALKTQLDGLDNAIRHLQLDKTNIGFEHKKKLERLEVEIGVAKGEISTQERLLDPEKLQRMRELVTKRAELVKEIELHVEANGRYVQAKTELNDCLSQSNLLVSEYMGKIDTLGKQIEAFDRAAELLDQVPCADLKDDESREECKRCPLLADATVAKKNLNSFKNKRMALIVERDERTKPIDARAQAAREALAASGYDETRAKACKAERDAIDAQHPADNIQRAEVAETKLAGLREKLTSLEGQHKSLEVEEAAKLKIVSENLLSQMRDRDSVLAALDSNIDTSLAMTKGLIESYRRDEKLDRDQLTAAKKDIESLQMKLDQRAEAQSKLYGCRKTLAELESDQADWTHLSQMLSRNGGFQSYLIETSAVEMTEFANELLKGYDVPWTIEIATSADTSDGKGKKDGFFVFVNTPTGQRELGDLSGGQAVWVDTILQHAVAFVQQRLSGKKLLTKILDEADGALDEERAIAYLNAIQAAHQQSGMWHTILISHRPEIQNMISQRIHFLRGKGIEIERD
ncbi:MAG: hypothetical protein WBP42_12560 [Candidatus Zixiibacteriota bacterium]